MIPLLTFFSCALSFITTLALLSSDHVRLPSAVFELLRPYMPSSSHLRAPLAIFELHELNRPSSSSSTFLWPFMSSSNNLRAPSATSEFHRRPATSQLYRTLLSISSHLQAPSDTFKLSRPLYGFSSYLRTILHLFVI